MKIVSKPLFLALLTLPGGFVVADDTMHPFINSKYSIGAGMFFPSKALKVRVDGTVTGPGREFDFDEATRIGDDDDVFQAEFKWRFGDKWSVRLQHFTSEASGKAVLRQDVTWKDETILAGSNVTAGSSFDLTRVFFGRSVDRRNNVDTGLGIGVHWLDIGAFIRTEVNTLATDVSAAKVSGPLPNIGAWYYYSPSPKWFIGGRLDWLEASIDRYDGGITNISAGVNYQLFQNVGLGLNYQVIQLDVDVDNDRWRGSVDLDFDGAFLYLSANW